MRVERGCEVGDHRGAGDQPVGLADDLARYRHEMPAGEFGRAGPGDAEQPGQADVDAFTTELDRHLDRGQVPVNVGVGRGLVGVVGVDASGRLAGVRSGRHRVPLSIVRPVSERSTTSAAPSTTAESARLNTGQCGSSEEVDDVPA